MASQFQNRLVGAVIIVAIGVIVLPNLFDGKKKHYEDTFASIPLVPKEGDDQNTEILPSVNHNLPQTPPAASGSSDDKQGQGASAQTAGTTPPDTAPPTSPPKETSTAGTAGATATGTTASTKPESKPAEAKPVTKPEAEKPKDKPKDKPVDKPQEKAPVGQAYIVQLGALKNADRVNELVATLRLSGYRVYTIPATPVQGKVTRLIVGPDPSKQKLESALPELNRLTGLSGQVKAYTTAR
ncbi:cell division protein DedD [Leminorella richardii]|uniref:Cell division protein DedD n=1 Tax=Leminorella richardii TaxID=158841 RepID=A0A2X4V8X3_9GAMM|nr:cell division protein DedD [Leminorella richardii]SQI41760.1 cell division protein DedD [Leminorella richardii]